MENENYRIVEKINFNDETKFYVETKHGDKWSPLFMNESFDSFDTAITSLNRRRIKEVIIHEITV